MPLLFSYGTLQRPEVQMSNFGRLLDGELDELIGFQQSLLTIEDPDFVKASGKSRHSIVRFTGGDNSRVSGTVFEVSESELARADAYEPAGYTRIAATLASGKQAWVFASDPAATDVASSAPDRAEAADYYFRYIDLFRAVRDASISFFRGLPGDAWVRRGIASGNPFSVRALAYLSAGHVVHHLGLIRSRYLNER